MGTLLERFRRTRKGLPCPVCEHSDWCMVEFDGSGDAVRVLCQRAQSDRRWGQAGWLHVLRDDVRVHGGAVPREPARRHLLAHQGVTDLCGRRAGTAPPPSTA